MCGFILERKLQVIECVGKVGVGGKMILKWILGNSV
jgi:hypothetical protein